MAPQDAQRSAAFRARLQCEIRVAEAPRAGPDHARRPGPSEQRRADHRSPAARLRAGRSRGSSARAASRRKSHGSESIRSMTRTVQRSHQPPKYPAAPPTSAASKLPAAPRRGPVPARFGWQTAAGPGGRGPDRPCRAEMRGRPGVGQFAELPGVGVRPRQTRGDGRQEQQRLEARSPRSWRASCLAPAQPRPVGHACCRSAS